MRHEAKGTSGVFIALSALLSLLLCFAALMLGVILEGRWLGADPGLNLRQVALVTLLASFTALQLTGAYRVGRKRLLEIGLAVFVSVIAVNLTLLALPFFGIHYVRSPWTAGLIAALQLMLLMAWAVGLHGVYYRIFPKRRATVVSVSAADAAYCADMVRRYSREFHVASEEAWRDGWADALPSPVVIAYKLNAEQLRLLQLACLRHRAELCQVPELWDLCVHHSGAIQFGDMFALRIKPLGYSRERAFFKRAFDIAFSALALAVLSLPLLILAGAVYIQDRANPFFSQVRLTRHGRQFKLYKLRTMKPDAERDTGPVLAAYDDPRVTRFGRFLRSTRLDEFPQFWNVLKGDMAVVGPRPERPHFHEQYCREVPEYTHRLTVKAGITGMAHIYGRYDTAPEHRIKLDLYYILHGGAALDAKLIAETVRVMLTRSYADGIKEPPE
jgi:exopolysaccharide biosynthesis polyprenyl glycosylphosphotransferase